MPRVKFALTTAFLAASVASLVGVRSVVARPRAGILKTFTAAIVHLLRKVFSENIFVVAWDVLKLVADEPLIELIHGHYKIVRLMNQPGTSALTNRYPRQASKYFSDYLARSFSKKSRREILGFHHRYLTARLQTSFYERILSHRALLWQKFEDQHAYAITLSFNAQWHYEGDLSLTFEKNGSPLYEISFTIVPGKLIGCNASEVLLVARVQGAKEQAEAIRTATRACHDIAPPHLLLAALQEIAGALDIGAIGGVSNDDQLAKSLTAERECYFDYDAFWETFLVREKGARSYEIDVPFPQKPLRQITTVHRRRTRLKRAFKDRIAADVERSFADQFLKLPSLWQGRSREDAAGEPLPSL